MFELSALLQEVNVHMTALFHGFKFEVSSICLTDMRTACNLLLADVLDYVILYHSLG